jgi:hypothetical protein
VDSRFSSSQGQEIPVFHTAAIPAMLALSRAIYEGLSMISGPAAAFCTAVIVARGNRRA